MNLKFIEEQMKDPSGGAFLRTTILYKPDETKLEVKMYEKTQKFTDLDIALANPNLLTKIKIENARAVFDKFYIENFIEKSN